jgi:GGDEF domain-containing protein
MSLEKEGRRALVVAAPGERPLLLAALSRCQLEGWGLREADNLEQAQTALRHEAVDIVLVDHSAVRADDVDSPDGLLCQPHPPVAYLAGPDAAVLAPVIERGTGLWLPRDLALAHPELLTALLHQAAARADLRRGHRRLGEALQEARRQVQRLVTLLCGLSPTDGHARWFTQGYMMERLQEEIARAQRHRMPLSLALGEVWTGNEAPQPADSPQLTAWAAERITRCKRHTDVAGQYGPRGFLLLLAHTPPAGAALCCRRLRAVLEDGPTPSTVAPGRITAYFGISSYENARANAKSLLGRAEECLEQAHRDGGAHVVL